MSKKKKKTSWFDIEGDNVKIRLDSAPIYINLEKAMIIELFKAFQSVNKELSDKEIDKVITGYKKDKDNSFWSGEK